MTSQVERQSTAIKGGRLLPLPRNIPWWIVILAICGLLILYFITTSTSYQETFTFLASGVIRTLQLTVVGYLFALVFGLIGGLGRISKNTVINTVATLYVEVIRGVPLLVVLIYIAFVLAPAASSLVSQIATALNAPFLDNMAFVFRDDFMRGVLGLSIGYGAYLSEVYRAGIESISRGQMEAARSLGMSYGQSLRYVVLPQAVRVILPPLGNDFIAMLKDSSLVSAIGAVPLEAELTLRGRMYSATTYKAFETWNSVALLYLMMSLGLSVIVRYVERRWSVPK
ncbi:MAG: amino acid ABC transporter permease [Chloroflexi bacterium]|nr:amino acid ABC transporter permease [Chloroflexota bacterium]